MSADSDYGVSDGDELNVTHGTDPCDSYIDFETTITGWNSGASLLSVQDVTGFNPMVARATTTYQELSHGLRICRPLDNHWLE